MTLRDSDEFVIHCPMCLRPILDCRCSMNKWIIEEGQEAQDWLPEDDE